MRRRRVRSWGIVAWSLALACIARPAEAAWRQAQFQVGGYLILGSPTDTTRLGLIDRAGFDWIAAYDQRTGPDAAALDRTVLSMRARPPFALRVNTYDQFPTANERRLSFNDTRTLDLAGIARSLEPSRGLNSEATLGWMIWDEPCGSTAFTNLGKIARLVDTLGVCGGKLAYVNLVGIHAYESQRGYGDCWDTVWFARTGRNKEEAYRRYLDAYLALFDGSPRPAPLLSIDQYPFLRPDSIQTDYFMGLRIAREEAAAHGRPGLPIPLWTVVQLAPFRDPRHSKAGQYASGFTLTNTRWQAYCALAYGAKGISYWLLTPARDPANCCEDWGAGFFDARGDTVSGRYSQVRALNRELHNLGPTLMRLDPVACIHARGLGWEGVEAEVLGDPRNATSIVSGFGGASDSALVGHLRDRTNGDDYLMIVNKSLGTPKTFSVKLSKVAASLYRVDRTTGSLVAVGVDRDRITVTNLPPGTGELFRIGPSAPGPSGPGGGR